MRPDRLTNAAQEALATAQSEAVTLSNPEINGLHVLAGLLGEEGGGESVAGSIVKRAGSEPRKVLALVRAELTRQPKSSSGAGSAGRALMEILAKAEEISKKMGDSLVSSEHLLLALAEAVGPARDVLRAVGLERAKLEGAVKGIREASGVTNVTDPGAESGFEALKKYGIDLTQRARDGKLDPVIGRDEEIRRCMQVLSRRT
ncbi:MAG: ATP-dependent chaperone ClpB, partial [Phycisphaeraceae bacterium]|nr:ATP-dependent chaperone ClpB [Phycisphaeraceae bacterium]